MNPLLQLHALGQRIWLDNLSRTLLHEGTLKRLIDEDGLAGVTSNPTIFYKAMSESDRYLDEMAGLKADPRLSPEARYERLAIPDIQEACDLLRPLYDKTQAEDGYVSLEVSPALAHDTKGTVAAARRLKKAVARDNLLVKVPATPEGIPAIETLISEGISINVTLMFSLKHVDQVAQAYIRGITTFINGGGDAGRVKSVASLFLSRVDTLVDKALEAKGGSALDLRGKAGVALAKRAFQAYKKTFGGPDFAALAKKGARPQWMLWASTGTKNKAYSDVMYVEPLIGPETINTLPDATLDAFRDHGKAAATVEQDVDGARKQYEALANAGIEMEAVGQQLQVEGVKSFADSFDKLLELMHVPMDEVVLPVIGDR
jgi:transaldolase